MFSLLCLRRAEINVPHYTFMDHAFFRPATLPGDFLIRQFHLPWIQQEVFSVNRLNHPRQSFISARQSASHHLGKHSSVATPYCHCSQPSTTLVNHNVEEIADMGSRYWKMNTKSVFITHSTLDCGRLIVQSQMLQLPVPCSAAKWKPTYAVCTACMLLEPTAPNCPDAEPTTQARISSLLLISTILNSSDIVSESAIFSVFKRRQM